MILFLDTSLDALYIAIVNNNSILYEFQKEYHQDMSKYLVFEIDQAFKQLAITPQEIEKIVISQGPGSFTGVRMGVTVAKTMAYALNASLYPISSLLVLASAKAMQDRVLVPMIDARRDYVYGGIYNQDLEILIPEQYILKSELLTMANQYENYCMIENDIVKPDVLKCINIALKSQPINPHLLKPNYLKITQAERELLAKHDS